MRDATYVLPLKWSGRGETAEMTAYLQWLSSRLQVIVVDGSPPDVYEHHADAWSAFVKHIQPDADLVFINGKVNGVITGVRAAGTDAVIIADDDIRFDEASLERTINYLHDNQLVIVQSYFDPTPFQALWDEARILLNRAFGVHFPAAMGISRDLFLAIGGYDGDVLFENLELIRSMSYAGARVAGPTDLFVRHRAPQSGAFWSQRVRQAYDDFALPHRMALWLSLIPLALRARARTLLMVALASVAMAEVGRRKSDGASVYPARASLFAPLWLGERAICSWVALYHRSIGGGVPYRGRRLRRAATPRSELRSRIERRLAHRDQER